MKQHTHAPGPCYEPMPEELKGATPLSLRFPRRAWWSLHRWEILVGIVAVITGSMIGLLVR